MALAPLTARKFQYAYETEAEVICAALNKGKYPAVALGSAVVSKCRPTKKLDTILGKFSYEETSPSDYDLKQVESV